MISHECGGLTGEYKNQDLLQALVTLRLQNGFGDEWLKIMGVKFIADGSIGGHTAALHEPYIGEPKNFGILVTEPNVLNEKVMKAHKNGLQVFIHAIGDRGIDVALDAIEMALKENPKLDHRHRIEHCGVCLPKQLERIKKINVFISSSTSFLYGVGSVYNAAIGEERMRWCYPHRSFIDYGLAAAGNSDLGAAQSADPLIGIYASVTRKDRNGKVHVSDQCITVEEAIRSYSIDGALIGFDEKSRGSIEEGKLADLVVLSDDPFSVPPDQLMDIKVDVTIVNGEVKFQRENY
jgi:predicted amidohydrolase YtcJ